MDCPSRSPNFNVLTHEKTSCTKRSQQNVRDLQDATAQSIPSQPIYIVVSSFRKVVVHIQTTKHQRFEHLLH